MILVTGASGNAGGAVLKEVLKTNRPVKAMYRSPEDAAKASAEAGAVIADFADKPSLVWINSSRTSLRVLSRRPALPSK
jgi:uncharacterized protein YbjT (DUF2867 family)